MNSHVEMAAAFHRAGFDAIDVHMSDLLAGRTGLGDFHASVACGGFSYGDVLGAGEGWAKSILFNERVRDEFATFFHRPQTLALGVQRLSDDVQPARADRAATCGRALCATSLTALKRALARWK